LNKVTGNARFDAATKTVVVDYRGDDGSGGSIHIEIDTAEAIHDAFAAATGVKPADPLALEDGGIYTVKSFAMDPHPGELHLILTVQDGRQGRFLLAAPESPQARVATIANELRRSFYRLIPARYRN
jgi:hypothetical protein